MGSGTQLIQKRFDAIANNINSTVILITVPDTTLPITTIISPQNTTYNTTSIDLNVSADESIDTWIYSLNSAGNTTFTPNTTITGEEGLNNIVVYTSDTSGNTNSSTVWFTVDTTPPTYSNLAPPNNSYTSDSGRDISIVITDEGSDVNAGSISMTVADNYYGTNSSKLEYDSNSGLLTYYAADGEFTDGQVIDVTVNAQDNSGNQIEVTWSFTVITAFVDSCTVISEPGIYKLTQDIFGSIAAACVNITSDDVIFDGRGHMVEGVGSSSSVGVYVGGSNVTVGNTVLANWSAGVAVFMSRDNMIIGNNLSSNYYGIYLSLAASSTISDNYGANNFCGIQLDYLSNDNWIDNNSLFSNDCGVGILGLSHGNNVSNNVLGSNIVGIGLDHSFNNTVAYNIVERNGYGIFLNNSAAFNIVVNNTAAQNNFSGIALIESTENAIYNNDIIDNVQGVLFAYSDNNKLLKNGVNSNNKGIYLYNSYNNLLAYNNVSSNVYGIYLNESASNLVYNNYFSNFANAIDLSPGNFWNVTLTPGTNIVGGPYIGGNYYSNYMGSDTDGDGIGEDPYIIYLSGIDYLPLVERP